jgi:Flp pilus assembly protein TadG
MSPSASSRPRRWRADRRGVAALEFGIIGAVFFTLMLGVVEISRYFATQQALHNLMGEALRQWQVAIGNTTGVNSANIGTICNSLPTPSLSTVPVLQTANVTFTGRQCGVGNGIITVQVTINYPYSFHAPLLPIAPTTLSETSQISF